MISHRGKHAQCELRAHPVSLAAQSGNSALWFVQNLEVVPRRVLRPQEPDAVLMRSNPKDLLVVTEPASSLSTIERLLLAESPGLQLAFTIDGLPRPVVDKAKMKSVLAEDARPLLVIPLHSSPLSGSTPHGVLPR